MSKKRSIVKFGVATGVTVLYGAAAVKAFQDRAEPPEPREYQRVAVVGLLLSGLTWVCAAL